MKKMGRDYCTGNPYEYDDGQPEPVPAPAEPAITPCSACANIVDFCYGPKHCKCSCHAAEYTCPRCGSNVSTHICMGVAGETKTVVPEFCPHGIKHMSGMACGNCEAVELPNGDLNPLYKEPAPAVAAPAEGNYTNRHGEPCSKECGEGRHSECKQSMFDGCNCTYRGLHTVPHRYANIGDGIERASTPPPAATVSSDLEGKLRELRDTMVNWTHCTPSFATNVVTEAAALGRAEGLEEAAKVVEVRHWTGQMIAGAIRALKEKV